MTQTKSSSAEAVKVIIRCRPMDEKEIAAGHGRVVKMDTKRGDIELNNPKASSGEIPKRFTFDAVYDWDSKQRELYDETFRPLVDSVLEGFNGTIFAYGQTGTGKTFTMQGVKDDAELRGVIPNSFDHIFSHIARQENKQYLVRASYLEIYKEDVRDLLHKDQSKRLEIKEKPDTGVYVKDLSSVLTKSIKEIEKVMNIGNSNRSVGSTNMNEHSSRSHAIFIVTVECSEVGLDGENHIRVGKLNMVDLAGSERQSKTGAEGERLKEATKINLSLSALGNVISALVDSKVAHVPYRDSKLTRLLQDSLGGNAKTVMVANIGPASYNYDETLNTLRYANRAKNIKNKPKINEDPKDALLREYQNEINRLKGMLTGDPSVKRKGKKKRRRAKKQRVLEDGTVEEYSEEEDDDGGEDDEANFMKEQQAKLDVEKEAILNNQTLIAEEKEKFLREVQEREQQLMAEHQKKEALQMKIKTMESKLLCGGENIVDHTNEQQRALERRQQEIAEQKRREREILKQMEDKEETMLALQDEYSSLQEEVDIKTKKLKKLFQKFQLVKQEINDGQEEHIRSRQDLERTQEELTRELKLKTLIIENFIPVEDKEKIVSRVFFDEEADTWRLMPLSKKGRTAGNGDSEAPVAEMARRPTSAIGGRRPMSEFSRLACTMGPNPRYKGENILLLELDLPNRTTRVYEPPAMAPQLAAALETALQDEEDIDVDGRPNVFKTNAPVQRRKQRDQKRVRSARPPEQEFPTSRGLVPK